MKKEFLLSFILLSSLNSSSLYASFGVESKGGAVAVTQQVRQIHGKVVDQNGEAVIGANVTIKGNKSVGTITDFDGNFTLNVSSKDVLVVSFIGYVSQEIKVGN